MNDKERVLGFGTEVSLTDEEIEEKVRYFENLLDSLFDEQQKESPDETGDSDMHEDDTAIVIVDDKGKNIKFDFLDLFHYGGERYVAMSPFEDDSEEDTVVFFKVDETEGKVYELVEDKALTETLFNAFKIRIAGFSDLEN